MLRDVFKGIFLYKEDHMKPDVPPNMIKLQKNKDMPNTYDVEMDHIPHVIEYDSLECHIVFYPYSREIQGENITFSPFEEYVHDILSHQRSAYVQISSEFNKIFGLFLGFIIFLIFYLFKPEDLFSVGSIVSVLGAYIIGKEVWEDIERMLVNSTKRWKIRYQEPYYSYQLEKHTTLTHYSYLAKERRYGSPHLLPEKIDFIQQSNSQTVRMCFDLKDLSSFEGPAHVLSIGIDAHLLKELETEGFLFGVKLSFNRRFLWFVRCFELFQSIDKDSKGCLGEEGKWNDGAVFYRKTIIAGRVKYYKEKGILSQKSIIEWSQN